LVAVDREIENGNKKLKVNNRELTDRNISAV